MFSLVERATTRTFVRVVVIGLAAALLCGSFPVVLLARAVDKTPCELPGDGEGTGGYKDYEFESAPNPASGACILPFEREDGNKSPREFRIRQVLLVVQFYLTIRK